MNLTEAIDVLDSVRGYYLLRIGQRSATAHVLCAAGWHVRVAVRRARREPLAAMLIRLAVKVEAARALADPSPRKERDHAIAASLGISL